jgi:hypothetical protein
VRQCSDDAVWRDAGPGEMLAAMRRPAADPRHALDRVQDVTFALDELTRRNRGDPAPGSR